MSSRRFVTTRKNGDQPTRSEALGSLGCPLTKRFCSFGVAPNGSIAPSTPSATMIVSFLILIQPDTVPPRREIRLMTPAAQAQPQVQAQTLRAARLPRL